MPHPTKPRFVLIDPSAIHMGGHHYEYAARILRIAREKGYEPELWAHRSSDLPEDEFPVFSVFRNTFYDNFKIFSRVAFLKALPGTGLRKLKENLRRFAASVTLPLFFERKLGLSAARAFHDCRSMGAYRPVYHTPQNPVRTSVPVYSFFFLLFTAAKIVKDLLNRRTVQRLLKLFAILLFILALPLLAVLGAAAALFVFVKLQKSPADKILADDLTSAIRARGPWTPRDILFLPTCFSTEIKSLGVFLSEWDRDKALPQFHMLFRTNVFHGHADRFREQMQGVLDYRLAFKWLRRNYPHVAVHHYTDTEQLAEQYKILSDEDFTVLPIPVPWMPGGAAQQTGPVKIAYVGDVRDEKGYQHYPHLVENLWDDFLAPGKIQFVLQSNFADNPLACPESARAQSLMRGYPERAVRHVQGPLDSAGYKQLIEESDIILLTYNPEPYMARSSGIFIEAMKAGKPVLMPAMTWMTSLMEPWRQARWHEALQAQVPVAQLQNGEWPAEDVVTLKADKPVSYFGALLNCGSPAGERAFVEIDIAGNGNRHSGLVEIIDRRAALIVPFAALPGDVITLRYRLLGATGGIAARLFLSETPWQGPLDVAAAIYPHQKPQAMAEHLRELLNNLDAYKAQASDFAAKYGGFFTPEFLVECMLKEAGA